MLTKLLIENEGSIYDSLALAPASVVPEHQNKGIGSELISKSLKTAKEIGFNSATVLGYNKYYPRFGFKPASTWGLKPHSMRQTRFLWH